MSCSLRTGGTSKGGASNACASHGGASHGTSRKSAAAVTKEQCEDFQKKPNVNPVSGRAMRPDALNGVHAIIKQACYERFGIAPRDCENELADTKTKLETVNAMLAQTESMMRELMKHQGKLKQVKRKLTTPASSERPRKR